MDDPSPGGVAPIGHHGVEHLVEEDRFHKPERDERGIQQGVHANEALLFLNGGEDKVIARAMASPPPPDDAIGREGSSEIDRVKTAKDELKVEEPPNVLQSRLRTGIPRGRCRGKVPFFPLDPSHRGSYSRFLPRARGGNPDQARRAAAA